MNRLRKRWSLLVVGLVPILIAGCGGGGGRADTRRTPLGFTINWAERARAITAPSSAMSATLTLSEAGEANPTLTYTINRDTDPDAYSRTYSTNPVEFGTYIARISFRAGANGTGDEVGVATTTVEVGPGVQLPTVETQGKVSTVTLSGAETVAVGETIPLTATAETSAGSVVAVSPGSVFWTVQPGTGTATMADNVLTGTSEGTVTVTARIDGVVSASKTITVSRASVTVRARLFYPSSTPRLVAFQDGDGPWVTLQPDGTGTYSGEVRDAGGRYSMVFVSGSTPMTIKAYQATVQEVTDFQVQLDNARPKANVSGTVTSLGSQDWAVISAGSASRVRTGSGAYWFSEGAPTSVTDVVAKFAQGYSVHRNTNLSSPQDFDASQAVGGTPVSLEVTGGLGGASAPWTNAFWVTGTGTWVDMLFFSGLFLIPNPAQRNSGDRYAYLAYHQKDSALVVRSRVSLDPDVTSLELPTTVEAPVAQEISGDERRFRVQWTTNDADLYLFYFAHPVGSNPNETRITTTKGWLGSQTEYTTPEFLRIPGFSPAWTLGAGGGAFQTRRLETVRSSTNSVADLVSFPFIGRTMPIPAGPYESTFTAHGF